MAAAIPLFRASMVPQPWHHDIPQAEHMLHDKSTLLNLEYQIFITSYSLFKCTTHCWCLVSVFTQSCKYPSNTLAQWKAKDILAPIVHPSSCSSCLMEWQLIVSLSVFFGRVGPFCFHLVFCNVLVKIYLGKLYTIGKFSSSSICWENFKICVFSSKSCFFSDRQNSFFCGKNGQLFFVSFKQEALKKLSLSIWVILFEQCS